MNQEQKAVQALNLLKAIAEDAPIKLLEHQLAGQSVDVIFEALRELHKIREIKEIGKTPKNKSGSILTNMLKEEIEIAFPSGKYTIPHSGFDRCCLNKTVSQEIPPGLEWIDVTWDNIGYDNNKIVNMELDHEMITIKNAGIYMFFYKVHIDSEENQCHNLRLLKKGSIFIPGSYTTSKGNKDLSIIAPLVKLSVGDCVVLQAKNNEKNVKNLSIGNSFLACERRY